MTAVIDSNVFNVMTYLKSKHHFGQVADNARPVGLRLEETISEIVSLHRLTYHSYRITPPIHRNGDYEIEVRLQAPLSNGCRFLALRISTTDVQMTYDKQLAEFLAFALQEAINEAVCVS